MSESLLDYIKVYRGCFSSQDCIEIINFVDDDEWQNSLISDDLKESKLYYDSSQKGLERILFIPPSYVDVARHAGGNLQQKDALKYLIGAYKDGELVKGDAQ